MTKIATKKLSALGALFGVLTLSGCSGLAVGNSDYGCSGVPEGVNCASARDVYEATNHKISLSSYREGQEAQEVAASPPTPRANVARQPEEQAVQKLEQRAPVPVRTPAEVMRIWFAPWEDDAADMHLSSYAYTEIQERRWIVGSRYSTSATRLTPLEVRDRPTAEKKGNSAGKNQLFRPNQPKTMK